MKPSLQERLETLQRQSNIKDNRCSVARFIAEYDEATQAALNAVMEDEGVSTMQIYKELYNEPNHPDRGLIGYHRKKTCKCHSVNA